MAESSNRQVVLFASDLMMNSMVSGFTTAANLAFSSASTIDDVTATSEDGDILLLIDLGLPGLDVQQLAGRVSSDMLERAVGYGPHVHREKLEAARVAGIGTVMSRGQFSAEVGSIVHAFSNS